MKVNELRIGNLVIAPFLLAFSSMTGETNEDRIAVVTKIENDGSVDVEFDPSSCLKGYDVRYLSPIPLTEELLLKCGFREEALDEDIQTYVFGKWDFVIHKNYINDDEFWLTGNEDCIIKYLHQLQNLYFAITGEELEIEL